MTATDRALKAMPTGEDVSADVGARGPRPVLIYSAGMRMLLLAPQPVVLRPAEARAG